MKVLSIDEIDEALTALEPLIEHHKRSLPKTKHQGAIRTLTKARLLLCDYHRRVSSDQTGAR